MRSDETEIFIGRLSKGEREAFEAVFRKYYGKVFNFISSIIKSPYAEDISQDLFVRLWEKRESLASVRSLDSYIYIMSRNAALDYVRKHRPADLPGDIAEMESDFSQEDMYFAAEKELAIRLAVAAMPDKRRRIFEMSRYEGKSNSEIAAALNISKKTVENQISLALAQLKKLVGAIVAFGIFTSV